MSVTGVGVLRSMVVMSPSAPVLLSPQHRSWPIVSSAQLCAPPAAIRLGIHWPAPMPAPGIATGALIAGAVPVPSSPLSPSPQQVMPAAAATHTWFDPAAIRVGVRVPTLTDCGVMRCIPAVPSPIWPVLSSPQHDTPAALIAHEKLSPHAIAVTPVRLVTFTGGLLLSVLLLPSSPSSPQQVTVWSPSSAQLCSTPSASWTALLTPAKIGVARGRPPPSPSCPLLSSPQQ